MAKSLGQIHTVNYTLEHANHTDPQRWLIDCAGELTSQLNHMVRVGNAFKIVGIDMVITSDSPEVGLSVLGECRYYAPTRGRVLAFRDAYQAVRRAMTLKGINPTSNINYDFRPTLTPPSNYDNGALFKNNASIQFSYSQEAWVPLCIDDNPGYQTIFDIWNAQQEPRQGLQGDPIFSTGYDIQLGGEMFRTTGVSTGTDIVVNPDYVLNEGMYLQTATNFASDEFEFIPFALTNSNDGETADVQLNWRPDPALYLSVLFGQFDVVVGEATASGAGNPIYDIDMAIHIAGWKSIMSDKKRRSKKGKKSHGRKRRSKK